MSHTKLTRTNAYPAVDRRRAARVDSRTLRRRHHDRPHGLVPRHGAAEDRCRRGDRNRRTRGTGILYVRLDPPARADPHLRAARIGAGRCRAAISSRPVAGGPEAPLALSRLRRYCLPAGSKAPGQHYRGGRWTHQRALPESAGKRRQDRAPDRRRSGHREVRPPRWRRDLRRSHHSTECSRRKSSRRTRLQSRDVALYRRSRCQPAPGERPARRREAAAHAGERSRCADRRHSANSEIADRDYRRDGAPRISTNQRARGGPRGIG